MTGEIMSTKFVSLFFMVADKICWEQADLHPCIRGWRWLLFLKPTWHSPTTAATILSEGGAEAFVIRELVGWTKFTDSTPKESDYFWCLGPSQSQREGGKIQTVTNVSKLSFDFSIIWNNNNHVIIGWMKRFDKISSNTWKQALKLQLLS